MSSTDFVPWVVPSVDAERMHTLARLLADPNPIHLDAGAVRALGMGMRTINQGPANMSYVLNLLHREFPDGRLKRFEVRFQANVFAGDHVSAGGRIDTSTECEGELVLACSVWLDVADGRRALEGSAVVGVPLRGGPSASN